jgi:hypothetical protein
MRYNDRLTTDIIQAIFTDEMSQIRGTLKDVFNDGKRLFARSTLPRNRKVAPRDWMQAGVALKATDEEICIHPFIFRHVCTNGAIMTHTLQTRQIDRIHCREPHETISAVREVVRECAAEEIFATSLDQIRSTRETQVDFVLNLMPMLSRLADDDAARLLHEIMKRHMNEHQSQFGLANAVTSLARDTKDPDLRWRLEEFGGGFLSVLPRTPPSDGHALCSEKRMRAYA